MVWYAIQVDLGTNPAVKRDAYRKSLFVKDFLEVRVIDGEMKRNQQTLGICRARQKYFSQLRVAMLCCRVNIYKTAEAEPLVIHRNKRWQCEALSLSNAT